MKKVLMILAVFVALVIVNSCDEKETIIADDCVYEWQIYENAILQAWEDSPSSVLTTPDGRKHTVKFAVVTPELQKLFEKREVAYKEYLTELESKGGIRPLGLQYICWWCACPNCGWCGNLYYQWGFPSPGNCAAGICGSCGYPNLNLCYAPVINGACFWDY